MSSWNYIAGAMTVWKSDQSSYLPSLTLILNISINMVTCSTPQACNVRVDKGEKERGGGGGGEEGPIRISISAVCYGFINLLYLAVVVNIALSFPIPLHVLFDAPPPPSPKFCTASHYYYYYYYYYYLRHNYY